MIVGAVYHQIGKPRKNPVVACNIGIGICQRRTGGRIAHFHGTAGMFILPVQIASGIRQCRFDFIQVTAGGGCQLSAMRFVLPLAEKKATKVLLINSSSLHIFDKSNYSRASMVIVPDISLTTSPPETTCPSSKRDEFSL